MRQHSYLWLVGVFGVGIVVLWLLSGGLGRLARDVMPAPGGSGDNAVVMY